MEGCVMEPSNRIKNYCDTVCDQMRWKKAKAMVSKEIENHLLDQVEHLSPLLPEYRIR